MRLRRSAGVFFAVAVAASVFMAAPDAIAKKGKKAKGPVVVGEDPDSDWGAALGVPAQLGDATGQELVGASIDKPDPETVRFVIHLKSLPASGGVPEFVRYVWDFTVNGTLYELDGKWLNYTRGICDPLAGSCPPPRDPGMQPFLLRTNCGPNPTVSNLIICEEAGLLKGVFDSAEGTITIDVPMAAIKAKPGSKIAGGTNTIGGNLSASPSAYVSSGNMPHDVLVMTKTYVVPR